MDTFTLPTRSNLHFSLPPAEVHKLVDLLLVAAGDGDGIRPDTAFADALATRLVRQMREEGMPLS